MKNNCFINAIFLVFFTLTLLGCGGPPNVDGPTETPGSVNRSPEFNFLAPQTGSINNLLSFQVVATDLDGDTLTYTLQNPPEGSSLDPASGVFSWTPTALQSGDYVFQFYVSDDRGGEHLLNVLVSISNIPAPMNLSSTSFTEGAYSDSLITLNFSLPKTVSSITATNWDNFFSVLDNNSPQTLDITELINNNTIVPSATSGDFSITLKGSVKKSTTGTINFRANYSDSSSQNFSVGITINSSGKPLFKYDIVNALKSGGARSVSRTKITNQIKTLNEVVSPYMTGILDDYQEKTLSCGSSFVYQSNDANGHRACVLGQVSSSSETVIFFETVTTSSGSIGGLSLGTRLGALVSNSSFNHTLIHELGHNFGLVHTHETYAAGNLHHSGSNHGVYQNGIFRRLTYSQNEALFPLQYGDGISDTDIDPFGSQYTASLNGGGGAFSSFNGAYEGESHFLYYQTQPISAMFTNSSYVCYQEYVDGDYYLNCSGLPPGQFDHNSFSYFDHDTINNIMSYWYKLPGEEHITDGQAVKILTVLDSYPEIR